MVRVRKQKEKICHCYNCGYDVSVSPTTVKEELFQRLTGTITATYVECPVCGERLLKQLDTEESKELSEKGVKLELLQRQGKKLSASQKHRLQSIEKELFNIRRNLKLVWWDEINQLLNPIEE